VFAYLQEAGFTCSEIIDNGVGTSDGIDGGVEFIINQSGEFFSFGFSSKLQVLFICSYLSLVSNDLS